MVYMAENGFGIHGHVSFFGFIWVYDTLFSPSSQGFPAKSSAGKPAQMRGTCWVSPLPGGKRAQKSPAQLPAGLGLWVRRPRPGGPPPRCRAHEEEDHISLLVDHHLVSLGADVPPQVPGGLQGVHKGGPVGALFQAEEVAQEGDGPITGANITPWENPSMGVLPNP